MSQIISSESFIDGSIIHIASIDNKPIISCQYRAPIELLKAGPRVIALVTGGLSTDPNDKLVPLLGPPTEVLNYANRFNVSLSA